MSNITVYDSDHSVLEKFFQWDKNQTVTVEGITLPPIPVFHICNRCSTEAYVMEADVVSGALRVNIPNYLLMQAETILMYIYAPTPEGGYRTTHAIMVPVVPRPKPDDYTYEDNIDYISVKMVDTRVTNLINSLSAGATGDVAAEVIDIRSGYDGTLYNAAGDAVRALGDQIEDLRSIVASLVTAQGGISTETMSGIQQIVRLGLADKIFAIGDQITCHRGNDALVWDVIGVDMETPTDPQFTHSLTLGLHDIQPDILTFDSREALFSLTDGLSAGRYWFHVGNRADYSADINKYFQFRLTEAVPAGGQIVIEGTWGASLSGVTGKTYASPSSTTPIETFTLTMYDDDPTGTSLFGVNESIQDQTTHKTNSIARSLRGSGKYSESEVRQYLNSADAIVAWTPQNVFDRPPEWNGTLSGFLYGVDEDFLAVLGSVNKLVALNSTCDGGDSVNKNPITISNKVFLLSRSEVFGGNEVTGNEGEPYPYYANYSDYDAPNAGIDSNRVKKRNGSTYSWWLRSPASNGSTANARYISSAGGLGNNPAVYEYGIAPICCII